MTTSERLETGRIGERAAETAYVRRGYRVIARNWRCRLGELDLVFSRAGTLVVCEVKTRRVSRFGEGWHAVDARKQAKLRAVAQTFLIATGARPSVVRFDVASVALHDRPRGCEAHVDVYEDAF